MPKVSDPVYPSQTGAQVANGDLMYIVDVGTPNVSKKITADELAQASPFSSRYGLTGTGSPEGVVTASVGARYIDTALTNGASEWVKVSGSSNTGWRVSSGDTSWRDISTAWKAALTAASATRFVNTGASYNIFIRRVGPQVFLNIYDHFQTDGTAFLQNVPGLIPSGFRPDVFPEQYCQDAPIFARNSASVVGKFEVHNNAGGGTFVMTATNPNNGFHAYWVTSQAWPSTLPGSAI